MSKRRDIDEEDWEDDREDPDESDQDDNDEEDTLPCPYCGKPVYEGADLCPHCRSYISLEQSRHRWPLYVRIGIVLAILALLTLVGFWSFF